MNIVFSVAKKCYRQQPFFTLLELIKEAEKGLWGGIEYYKGKKYQNYKKYLRSMRGIGGIKTITWIDYWIKLSIEEKIREEMNKI